MMSIPQLLRNIYNAFDPFRPLPAGDPAYVNCSDVRGEENILIDLGREITLSQRLTHQLYTGHRGAGKTTELLRLAADLEVNGYQVVYFAAEEEDIDPEDAQYTDILLACTRHLLKTLKGGQSGPILQWLQSRKQELAETLKSEISFDEMGVEVPFTKLTSTLKVSPTARDQIRRIVEPHTPSLIEALNQFIREAMAQTPQKTTDKLVLMVDSLDRIPPVIQEAGARSNHEQIFLDRSEQLKMLDCHVIYTVPISLVYSGRLPDLRNTYDSGIQVLPMIMVRHPDTGEVCPAGLAALKDIIAKRMYGAGLNAQLKLAGEVFDSEESLNQLCLLSGGHVRNLMQMAQDAIKQTVKLPIDKKAVRLAITKERGYYRNAVYHRQWPILARVAQHKTALNDEEHRALLFNRCVLEYRYFDDAGELQCWHDVHPLIRGIKEFQAATAALEKSQA